MSSEPSPPPIASPHGDGKASEQPPTSIEEITTRFPVSLSLGSAWRSSLVEFLYPINFFVVLIVSVFLTSILYPAITSRGHNPFPLFSSFEIWVLCAGGFVFLMTSIFTFWNLLFSRRFEVEIQSNGLFLHYPRRDVDLTWSKIFWILHLDGNIWVATTGNGCLIPRECFASHVHSRRFAHSLNQLRDTQGAAWKTIFDPANSHEQQPQ